MALRTSTDVSTSEWRYEHTSLVLPRNADRNLVVLVALADDKIPFAGESLGIMEISGYLQARKGAAVQMFDMQLSAVDQVIDYVRAHRPGLLGFSVKYNTLNQLLNFYARIHDEIPVHNRPILIVGNALPAYIDETLLRTLLPDTVIGLGDGEVSMGDLFDFVQGSKPLSSVRNVAYLDCGTFVRRTISSHRESEYTLPDRSMSKTFYDQGGLIYAERSRGCHWGRCTFCPREHEPMSNIENVVPGRLRRGSSWRARATDKVIEDLRQLQNLGIGTVRFTDEEFIGPGTLGIQRARDFARAVLREGIRIQFDVIAKVDSVCNHRDDEATRRARTEMWTELVASGLVKVALGVETFDPEQLKRYSKGVTLKETHDAIRIVKQYLGIELEIGFITVDVMSTLENVQRTLSELQRSEADLYASTAFKEMRVYHGTPYLALIKAEERRAGQTLLGPLTLNTLEYPVLRYIHDDVDILVRHMRGWNRRCYELFYLLRIYTNCSSQAQCDRKAFSSTGGPLLIRLINQLRELEFRVLLELINVLREHCTDLKRGELSVLQAIRRNEATRSAYIRQFARVLGDDNRGKELPSARLRRSVSQYLARVAGEIEVQNDVEKVDSG